MIRNKTKGKEILEKMQHMITSGQWSAGTRLPSEKELMNMFNASRISIREPLKQLVSLGVVETRHGSGTYVLGFNENSFVAPLKQMYVQALTKQDVLKILEVRQIEITTVSLAAERSDKAGVDKLRQIHMKMENGINDIHIHHITDFEFHLQINKMSNNPYFLQISQIMYDILEKAFGAIVRIMGPQKALYYHPMLIDTIERHYIHEAKMVMQEHLETTIEAVRAIPDDADVFAPLD